MGRHRNPRRPAVGGWLAEGFRPPLPGAEAPSPAELLTALATLRPDTHLRRHPGRETFAWPGEPGLVVKRMQGGASAEWWHEAWGAARPRSPARREAEILVELARLGLPVPRALAWAEERAAGRHPWLAPSALSAFVMEHVAHRETVLERIEREGAVAPELRDAVTELVCQLHGHGWYHRDLYLEHLVQADDGRVVLLDVGRARHAERPRRRWFVKDLAALVFSAPPAVSRRERLRFLSRWLRRMGGTERERWKDWVSSVEAKVERMAAHVPRHDPPRGAASSASTATSEGGA